MKTLLPALLVSVAVVSGSDLAVTYEFSDRPLMRVVVETIVSGSSREARLPIAAATGVTAVAHEKSSGKTLPVRLAGKEAVVQLAPSMGKLAQPLIVVEQSLDRSIFLKKTASGYVFETLAAPGRHTVVLPAGWVVKNTSTPVQMQITSGRMQIGVLHAGSAPLLFKVEAAPGASAPEARLGNSFRAADDRRIEYEMEEPSTHRIQLWLEMIVPAGRTRFYSELRKDDSITNPRTLDLDRGTDMPTQILTGAEANKLDDVPSKFDDDASVLVAELGYKVPQGAFARVRSYQTATDRKGYGLAPDGSLLLNRFVARAATRYIFPAGWDVTSTDQPAVFSTDAKGRTVADFAWTGGDATKLVVTGRKRTK
jgi:hypothetical protein